MAIKIINKEKIYDFSDRQRLNLEIQILKNTYHYNLIKIYQVIETPNTVCMIMEYAEGGELFDYIIKNDYLSEDESRNIFHQIIDAIDYMHQLGICHRDLKPENILFDSSHKNIKIIDFGLSNLYYTDLSIINDEQNSYEAMGVELLETPCGSPGYAPPEMVLGYCYNGLLTDIWSSGIILFAMLCGSFPFDDDSEQILYSKIIKGKYEFPKEITLSEEAKNLIKKILVVNPDYRANIDDIKNDPWFKKDYKPIYGLFLPIQEIPIDDFIIREIEKKGYSKEDIIKNIKNNRHNEITTFYYLLVKKYSRNGIDSVNNLISPSFNKYILEENEKNKELKDRKISINLKLIFEKLKLEEEERIEKAAEENKNINKEETNDLKKGKENDDNNIKNILNLNNTVNKENKKERKEILNYISKIKPQKDKDLEGLIKKQETNLNKNNETNKNINNTNMTRSKEDQLKNFKNIIFGIKDKKFKKLKKLNKIIDKKQIYQNRFKKLNNPKKIINSKNIKEITNSINFIKDGIINLSFPYHEGDLNNTLVSSQKREKYIFQGRMKTDRANFDKNKNTIKTLIKKENIPLYQKFRLNCNENRHSHKKNNKSNYHYINKVVKNSKASSFNVFYMNKSIKLKNINPKINNTNHKIASKANKTKNLSVYKEKGNMSYRYLNKNKNLLESNLSRILNHSEAKSSSNSKSKEKKKPQNYSQFFTSTRNKNTKIEQKFRNSQENSENNFCYKKINKFRIENKERKINNLKLNPNKSNDNNNINFSININLNLNQIKNKDKGTSIEQKKYKKIVKSLKGIKLDLKNIINNYPTYNGNSISNSEKNNYGNLFKLKKDLFLNKKKNFIKISKNKVNYLNKHAKNKSHSKEEKKLRKNNSSFKKQKSFQNQSKKNYIFANSLSKILPFLKSMNSMKTRSQKKATHKNINNQNDNSKNGNTFSNKSNSIIINKAKSNLNKNDKRKNQIIKQINNNQKLINFKNIKNWNNSYTTEVPLTKNKTLDQSKFNIKKSPINMKMKPLNLKGFIKSNNNNPYSFKSLTMRGDKTNNDILFAKDELSTSGNKTQNNNQENYVIKKIKKNEKFINNDAIFDISPLKIKDILLNQLPINNIFITQKSSKENYFIFHCFKGKVKLIIELLQIKENNFVENKVLFRKSKRVCNY